MPPEPDPKVLREGPSDGGDDCTKRQISTTTTTMMMTMRTIAGERDTLASGAETINLPTGASIGTSTTGTSSGRTLVEAAGVRAMPNPSVPSPIRPSTWTAWQQVGASRQSMMN
uniref:(northern house mosquito) hypothetical protein n=1 Tax=Culex pipiens TaxID=7175 RepID=A0A8D8MKS5_CULPI